MGVFADKKYEKLQQEWDTEKPYVELGGMTVRGLAFAFVYLN